MSIRIKYDVKIQGARVPLDIGPGLVGGVLVQDPVYIFKDDNSIESERVLLQGDDEYMFHGKKWFGSTDKSRMLVTEYYDSE